MHGQRARIACAIALGATLIAPACTLRPTASSPEDAPAARRAVTGAPETAPYPETISFADSPTPPLAFREIALPPGTEITDYTTRIAVYARYGTDNPHAVLGLVDLATSERRDVLRRGVNEALRYNVVAPRISDTWMAWEEVDPNETNDPRNTPWRLYAAPLDASKLAIGEAKRIDGGVTNYKLRPHYAVLGSTVYWTANRVSGPHQESFPPFGTIEALNLETGEQRTIARTNTVFETLCAADGALSVTERVSKDPSSRVRSLLIDPASGKTLATRDLGNKHALSHFVRASGGRLAWAVFPAEESEWPSLYVAPRAGANADATAMAGISSIDPAFFGRYMAFESVQTRAAPAGGVAGRVRRIWVADPERGTRSVLLETNDTARDGWWQTCASGLRTNTLLLWNDLGPWTENESDAKTLVRLYRAPD